MGGDGPPQWNLTSDLTITFQPHSGNCLSCATPLSLASFISSVPRCFLFFFCGAKSWRDSPRSYSVPPSPLLMYSTAVHSVTLVSEMMRFQLLSSFTAQQEKPVFVFLCILTCRFVIWICGFTYSCRQGLQKFKLVFSLYRFCFFSTSSTFSCTKPTYDYTFLLQQPFSCLKETYTVFT